MWQKGDEAVYGSPIQVCAVCNKAVKSISIAYFKEMELLLNIHQIYWNKLWYKDLFSQNGLFIQYSSVIIPYIYFCERYGEMHIKLHKPDTTKERAIRSITKYDHE